MISDAVIVALITGIPPTLAAIAALVVSLRNSKKADANIIEVAAVKQIAERTSKEVVRSKDEIDLMKTGAFHRGVKAGQKHESDFQRLHGKSSDLGGLY